MLGDTSSSMISPRQERALGQEWLRLYRSQVPTSSDHQIIDYLEGLVDRLAPHSQLQDPQLSLVLAENNRSEERRVGKECRSRRAPEHHKGEQTMKRKTK